MKNMNYSEKQLQIINTAERLFSTKGFDGTSVRDIADDAGVNIAMISYYFGSKEKLMEALFERRSSDINMRVETLLQDSQLGPFEKMISLVEGYIEKVMQKQPFFKIMMCEQVINKNPVIIQLINDSKKKNAEAISKLIKDGQATGVFKKDVDVLLLINSFTGTITQTMLTKDHYKEYYGLQNIPDDQFVEQMKEKLGNHIKFLFKALLSYEA
jgi:AcrR family transcriptional regulator